MCVTVHPATCIIFQDCARTCMSNSFWSCSRNLLTNSSSLLPAMTASMPCTVYPIRWSVIRFSWKLYVRIRSLLSPVPSSALRSELWLARCRCLQQDPGMIHVRTHCHEKQPADHTTHSAYSFRRTAPFCILQSRSKQLHCSGLVLVLRSLILHKAAHSAQPVDHTTTQRRMQQKWWQRDSSSRQKRHEPDRIWHHSLVGLPTKGN